MRLPFFKSFFWGLIFSLSFNLGYAHPVKVTISNLPPSNEHFIGRKEILNQIRKEFKKDRYIVTLVGFLGIGKTQIARKFAEQSKEEYDIVWFMDAKGSIIDQLRGLALLINDLNDTTQEKKINVKAQPANFLEQMHTFLKTTPKKWLLILDNVQERGEVLGFLPPSTSQGKILITTRSDVGWENPLRISNFSHEESLALLRDLLQTNDEELLNKLAALLFNHPLSLVQAGCYIRKHNHINADAYMTLFTSRRKDLWKKEDVMIKEDKDLKDLHDSYEMTGGTALRLSLEDLKTRSPLGMKLLYHTAFLHNTEIPADILSALSKTLGYEPVFDCSEAIHQLTKLSFLEKDRVASQHEPDNSLFNMHDLTQVVLLDAQCLEEKKQAIATDLMIFSQIFSGGWNKVVKDLTQRPYLLAHLESLCAHAKDLKVYNTSLIELMTYLVEYHMYHTRDQRTYEKLVKEIDTLVKETPHVSPVVLARFYSDRVYTRSPSVEGEGKLDKRVVKDYETAIQTFQETPHHIEELFRTYMNFAQYYFLRGKFEEAKFYIKKSDELVQKIKNETYKNLFFFVKAWVFCEMEEYDLAHQAISEAVKRLDQEESLALQIYIKNMKAWADLKTGDYEGAYHWAVKAQQEALDFFDHDTTDSFVWSTLVIGVYKKQQGDLEGAEAAVKESLVRLEKEYAGPLEVTDQAFAHTVLGDIYVSKGNLSEAKKEYHLAEKIYNKLYSKKEGIGISELYVSFAILGTKLKDDLLAKHYLNIHQKYYGRDHQGTKKILQVFQENGVDVL